MNPQPSLFDQPELLAREEALDRIERSRKWYLDRLRTAMRTLYFQRSDSRSEKYWVDTDDARPILENELRPPHDMSRNMMGGLFRSKGWKAVGTTHSQLPGSHGNRIVKWVYVGD